MTVFPSDKLRFVLINTTHPGNIGATARAMKNMGFTDLSLVCPRIFPDQEATARSSGAEDILQSALVVNNLEAAINDCNIVFGTSSRKRALPVPLLTAKEAAHTIKQKVASGGRVAILFGQERMGLTNEQLALCHYHLYIPCNADFPSLNLAAAVQVIAYELYSCLESSLENELQITSLVTTHEMARFYEHLEKVLIKLEFLDPNNPRLMMRKLRRLFNRAGLEQNEMNILRGILTTINKKLGDVKQV